MAKTKDKSMRKKLVLLICLIFIVGSGVVAAIFLLRNDETEPLPPPVFLTYANWNMSGGNPLEVQMILAFMDEYPHITVTVDHNIDQQWTQGISAAAAENRLPDVFAIDDLGTMVANGWLLDITYKAQTDLDFLMYVPRIMHDAVLVDGYVYALPATLDLHGYFINRDLFRALGLTPPEFGISADDFVDLVQHATDLSHPSIGLNHSLSFMDWLPGAINPALGFFAYDASTRHFALDSPKMHEAIRVANVIHNDGFTFNGIPNESVRNYFQIGYDLGEFRYGHVAMFYGAAWMMDIMLNQVDFDWDFIGVPGGRFVTTLDALGISAHTAHPEEAYLLARWMGHGVEGNIHRIQHSRALGITMSNFPISQNTNVLDNLWLSIPAPGFRSVYSAMDRALVDGARVMPGYMQARFSAPTGVDIPRTPHNNATVGSILTYSIWGNINFADHSEVAEEVMRQQIEAGRQMVID